MRYHHHPRNSTCLFFILSGEECLSEEIHETRTPLQYGPISIPQIQRAILHILYTLIYSQTVQLRTHILKQRAI